MNITCLCLDDLWNNRVKREAVGQSIGRASTVELPGELRVLDGEN